MRPVLLLAGSFIALLAALAVLWAHRYERAPGLPVWRLADLRQGTPEVAGVEWAGSADEPLLRLVRTAGKPPVALRLALPGAPAVEMLQLRYHLAARGLTLGKEEWASGRMMIEWFPPDGSADVEKDPVGGAKLDDRHGPVTLVAAPAQGPAVPALRLEHLGRAGEFEISALEITAVKERQLWKTGRWVLALGWLAWTFACIRAWPGVSRWRALAAAAVWVLMGIHFAIPGPWKIQRPLGTHFRLGETAQARPSGQAPLLVEPHAPVQIASGAIPASGDVRVQGGMALRARYLLRHLRILLHVALLAAPTLAFAILLGRRNAIRLAIPLALAIEAAQVALGYGFDWVDVIDLLTDAAGIALGLWLAARLERWLRPLAAGRGVAA